MSKAKCDSVSQRFTELESETEFKHDEYSMRRKQ